MNKLLSAFGGSHRPDLDSLSGYLDGQLSPSRTAALERHLATCAACRERLADLRDVRSALSALPEAEAPRSFRLQPWQTVPERAPTAAPRFVYAAASLATAAAVALVVLIAVDVSRGGSGEQAGGGRTAFTAQKDAQNASAVAGTAASSADRAAGASAIQRPPSPPTENSLQDETTPAGARAFASAPGAPSNAAPTPPSPEKTLADSAAASAPSPTAATAATAATEAFARNAPPTQDVAATSKQQEPSSGGGIGALRISEIIAGVMIVVMGGLILRVLAANRRKP